MSLASSQHRLYFVFRNDSLILYLYSYFVVLVVVNIVNETGKRQC